MFGGGSPKNSRQSNDFVQAVAENKVDPLKQFIAREVKAGEVLEKVKDKDGRSLLHVAAFEGSGDVLLVLLRCPKLLRKLNSTDPARRTPLHLSAAIGDEFCVRSLASAGAMLDPLDEWGCTPLHLAIKFEQLETTKLLLDLGADALREDVKGDNAVDMARSAKNGEFSALLMSFQSRKKPAAWKCLLPNWGNRRRQAREDAYMAEAAAQGGDDQGLRPPPPPRNLPVAERLAGNTQEMSPTRPVIGSSGWSPATAKNNSKDEFSIPYPPPPPNNGYDAPATAVSPPAGAPLSAAIAEAARAHSDRASAASTHAAAAAADVARHPFPQPAPPATTNPAVLAPTGGGSLASQASAGQGSALAAKTARPAELYESDPRIEWHGMEAVYVAGEAPSGKNPAADKSSEGGEGLGGWLMDKLAPARPPIAAAAAAPTLAASKEPKEFETDDSIDDTESDVDESDRGQARVNCGGGPAGPFRFHFLFNESVSRLGFEVAWQRTGEDEVEPSVGAVQEGGAAASRRVETDDDIVMCNDTPTDGKVRADVIPLLKKRPLLLKVHRMLQLVDRSISCVTIIASIGEEAGELGIKLSRAGDFPALAMVRPGSAAEAAGLLAGDALVGVGTESQRKLDAAETKAALQKRPLLLTMWRLPVGLQQWPEGFEAWDDKGFSHTIVDLRPN